MNVHLTWFGQLRDAAGVVEETVAAEQGATVLAVLASAASARGGQLRELLMDGEAVASTILVSLDDVQVVDASTTSVKDGARLVVMAPMSGG